LVHLRVHHAIVKEVRIRIVVIDFQDFSDEAAARSALNVHDHFERIADICLDCFGAIYHTHWSSIFSYFGLNLNDFGRDQAMFAPPKTQLVASSESAATEAVVIPLASRGNIKLDKTNLLSRLLEIWGEVPIRMLQHIDTGKCEYGCIGMSDFTMFPILRPGSIVQIDGSQQKISHAKWKDEHDRPIYFIELRGEFICSWCEVRGGNLLAVPSPHSRCAIRQFVYPRDAEIVGRVTGVAMRLAEPHP
jgi:hypothetical protein